MADDLIASKLLDGLTKEKVEDLLGKPDKTEYFYGWDFVYWLGDERGVLRIDSEWLMINFNDDGRVSEYTIDRD
ncbi:MAG: outer membrane protein assembly factor BamE [Oligoflexales bacterium]|nr:outer membrane protein assembly factor BamE [Oligoflexales bacterium]